MTRVDLLPCGCPIEGSLFEHDDDARRLIVLDPIWDGNYQLLPGKVWCTQGHGWVKADDGEFERLAAVTA